MSLQYRVVFLRNFTIEPIEMPLRRELASAGIDIACDFGGFSNSAAEIDALERRTATGADVNLTVVALGLELTASDFGHASWAASAACDRHLMLVRAAVERCRTPLVINTVLPPLSSASGLAAPVNARSHAELVDRLNAELHALAAAHPGHVALIDWTAIARQLGERETYDYRFWYSSGAPFAVKFLRRYAAAIAGVVRSLRGKARKCLVLDCDNTLWGGVLGEDGIEGIRLSSDTLPGAYFQAFQRSVLDLQARGVIIALCSKNNEADVLDVIDNHPDCLLRREHLATWRVNWNEKAQSIAELSDELNIGRDSIVFVDDSAHECALVRAILPEVEVLQTPERHEALVGFLSREHFFDALAITSDDLARGRSYSQNREREALSVSVGDLSEYKRQLDTQLTVRHASRADIPRIAQLVQRTNQFNLTTRRHDHTALETMLDAPEFMILCSELKDRFGNLGLIGVAIAEHRGDDAMVDTLLMSCRALGRDAEMAFMSAVYASLASEWRVGRIYADYIATAKNQLVADFWVRAGLVADETRAGDAGVQGYVSSTTLSSLAARIMPPHVNLMGVVNGH